MSVIAPLEDKFIMAERTRLEIFWYNGLTDIERTYANAFFDAHPPRDVAGRKYITTTPQAMNEIQVGEPTRYAWSQIYGTFRFKTSPVTVFPTHPTVAITFTLQSFTTYSLLSHVVLTTSLSPPYRVISFLAEEHNYVLGTPQYHVRPCCFFNLPAATAYLDCFKGYVKRYGSLLPVGHFVAQTFSLVDQNNMLRNSTTISTGTITA